MADFLGVEVWCLVQCWVIDQPALTDLLCMNRAVRKKMKLNIPPAAVNLEYLNSSHAEQFLVGDEARALNKEID